jgi:hypothetical protein
MKPMLQWIESIGTLVLALAALVVSLVALIRSNRAADRDSYMSAHQLLSDLTTAEVAQARDAFGILRFGTESGWKSLTYSEIVRDYYVLEWALERTAYGFAGLHPAGRKVVYSMRGAAEWHVREILGVLGVLHKAFGREMGDSDSWNKLRLAAKEMGVEVGEPDPDQVAEVTRRIEALKSVE